MKKILSNELHQIFDVEGTNGLATAILLDLGYRAVYFVLVV
jgi:hypothetical protein